MREFKRSLGTADPREAKKRFAAIAAEYDAFIERLEAPPLQQSTHDLGWGGQVQNISYGSHKLNPSVWKVCSSLVGVAPPTLTADLSFLAALLVEYDVERGRVRRPTLNQVRTFASVSVAFMHPGRRRKERDNPYLPHPAVEWLEREFGPGKAKKLGNGEQEREGFGKTIDVGKRPSWISSAIEKGQASSG
jgi:hypothetical protein